MRFLDEVRADREDLARVLKKHKGIRRTVEELYPDTAHFIYELLQNAEDTKATEASFKLNDLALVFEHNGHPFSKQDVWAITDIGEGTKANAVDTIGRFGVGFKAVFAYTETPRIWSPTFSFEISDLVLPTEIATRSDLGANTRFEFPFNNAKKPPREAYAEVQAGLEALAETTLLFLTHLKSLRWQVGGRATGDVVRREHSESHVELIKGTRGKAVSSSHFLRFSKPVDGLDKQCVSIAFALEYLPNATEFDPRRKLGKQMKIVPVTPACVSVFFPAEKETSGLRFHLHAPFVPELSRASIKETPANEPLFSALAQLAASSMHSIRTLELLSTEFLSVLPNPQDNIPLRYKTLQTAIVKEMNTEALTPTHDKSHAPATRLLQAKAAIKELLSPEDLEFLIDYEEEAPQWAASASQRNSNADRFLSGLALREWDIPQFVETLEEKASSEFGTEPDDDFMSWLETKSMEWHQQFYAMLRSDIPASPAYIRKQALDRLKPLKIVRISTGTHSIATECYFPTDGVTHDKILPRVASAVYSSGNKKTQKEEARKLLEEIGVREVGETEEVHAILKLRYSTATVKPHATDLSRFVALVSANHDQAEIFADFHIFERADGKWGGPNEVYLDRPYLDTGLDAYYRVVTYAPKAALSTRYQKSGIALEKLRKFAEAVGVQTQLAPENESTKGHPNRATLRTDYHRRGVRWTDSAIDEDWTLPELDELLDAESVDVSRLIWRTMCHADDKSLVARFRPNRQYPVREQPSSLVLALKKAAWVPQGGERFVCPPEASRDLLPSGFPFDSGQTWLEAIGFGTAERQRSEEHIQRLATAKALGFEDAQALQDAQWFAALDANERQRFREESLAKQSFEMPESDPTDSERRRARVKGQAAGAPGRLSAMRLRSVSVGREDVKGETEQYLRDLYTNPRGVMICQICKGALPFQLDDGSYYVEKVELFQEMSKRHYQNYLALCPNHSAMFTHAHESESEMLDAFLEMNGQELDIILAGRKLRIFFNRKHKQDLEAVIDYEQSLER